MPQLQINKDVASVVSVPVKPELDVQAVPGRSSRNLFGAEQSVFDYPLILGGNKQQDSLYTQHGYNFNVYKPVNNYPHQEESVPSTGYVFHEYKPVPLQQPIPSYQLVEDNPGPFQQQHPSNGLEEVKQISIELPASIKGLSEGTPVTVQSLPPVNHVGVTDKSVFIQPQHDLNFAVEKPVPVIPPPGYVLAKKTLKTTPTPGKYT